METLKTFKISENQKGFDIVELIENKEHEEYIVRWKWNNMKFPNAMRYKLFVDAIEKYRERKQFAIMCN